jgi:hypothetical protein
MEIKDFSDIFHLFLSVFFDFRCFSNYDTKKNNRDRISCGLTHRILFAIVCGLAANLLEPISKIADHAQGQGASRRKSAAYI